MSFTERLIEIVKANPILYDLGDPEYKNIRKRDKVWDKIGTEMKESGDEVKRKWKNLRDSYSKYLKSTKTSTGQSAKRNYKNWQWAPLMEPFKPYLAFAKTDSNITEPVYNIESPDETITRNITDSNQISDSPSRVEKEREKIIDQSQSNEAHEVNYEYPKELQVSTPSTSKSISRRKTPYSHSSSVETVMDYLKNKKVKKELTPTDMIFLGYSQILQTFSPRRQAQTKMRIAEIMTEQECLHLEEKSKNSQAYFGHVPRPLSFQGVSNDTYSTDKTFTTLRSPEETRGSTENSLLHDESIPPAVNSTSPEESTYSIMVLSEDANPPHYDINPSAGTFLNSFLP